MSVYKPARPKDWEEELARFEGDRALKRRVFRLSSPGVAQVTRCRMLNTFDTKVRMRTEKNHLIWEK